MRMMLDGISQSVYPVRDIVSPHPLLLVGLDSDCEWRQKRERGERVRKRMPPMIVD
jgi:hypothetical protein